MVEKIWFSLFLVNFYGKLDICLEYPLQTWWCASHPKITLLWMKAAQSYSQTWPRWASITGREKQCCCEIFQQKKFDLPNLSSVIDFKTIKIIILLKAYPAIHRQTPPDVFCCSPAAAAASSISRSQEDLCCWSICNSCSIVRNGSRLFRNSAICTWNNPYPNHSSANPKLNWTK